MDLHIGILIPRSATYPMLSQYLVRGIKLAFATKNINAQFTIEDIGKGSNVEDIIGKANSLLINDVELCFAMVGSNTMTQLGDVFSQSGIPLLLLDAGANINYSDDYKPTKTTFIHNLGMWQSVYALGEFAAKKFNKVVSTSSLFDAGFQFLGAFSKGLESNGGEIVGYHSTQQFLEDDFKVKLKNTISEGKPKALLCLYSGNDADEFFSKFLVKGYDGGLPILTTPMGLGSGEIELDSVTLASTWFAELENKENQNFVEAYTKKYKKTPDLFAALGYEAAHTVATLVETKQEWDGEEIVTLLATTKHKGIRGDFSYDCTTGETTNFASYLKQPNGVLEKHIVKNIDEIKAWQKEQFSSGWFNPYPCS